MLEIDIKLNPYGSDTNVRMIGNIFIANIKGSSYNFLQDYIYMIYNPASRFSNEEIIHGVISDHDANQSVSNLLRAVMLDYGESACDLSEEYANHWYEERL